jgi:hypothetical protein
VAIIGYGRVSTTDQNPQLQLDALRDAGAARVFTDHGVSASTASRAELDACSASPSTSAHDRTNTRYFGAMRVQPCGLPGVFSFRSM